MHFLHKFKVFRLYIVFQPGLPGKLGKTSLNPAFWAPFLYKLGLPDLPGNNFQLGLPGKPGKTRFTRLLGLVFLDFTWLTRLLTRL